MRIKKYISFVNEDKSSESVIRGVVSYVRDMIQNTIDKDNSGGGDVKSFAKNYKNKPEDVSIEGLINDEQVYDFWLKYDNVIDEILNDVNFFNESPDELNSVGTYMYIITSTKRAILEIVKKIAA
jgi:hypothetical protein